jgi:AcrR family transcriptional regulator
MFAPLKPEVYQRLEQAVLDIFSHSDFHKANIRDVANRAGVSFSTIYKHYGSKERLVFAFVDVWLGKLTERIYDHLQGIEDLKEKMRKVLWLQLDYYERNPGLARIIFMTLPMETWMADETFKQKKMINLYLEVMRNGQKAGQLNPHVRAGQKWKDLATKQLRGKALEDLAWDTPEGIRVNPLYTAEDLEGMPHVNTLPGSRPMSAAPWPPCMPAPLDHSPVCRFFHGQGIQRILPAQPGRRPEGPFGGL